MPNSLKLTGRSVESEGARATIEANKALAAQRTAGTLDFEEQASMSPRGWYPDPHTRHELRFWDGASWTSHVSNRGVVGTDHPHASQVTSDDRSRTQTALLPAPQATPGLTGGLSASCGSCGSPLPAGAGFCTACGRGVAQTPVTPGWAPAPVTPDGFPVPVSAGSGFSTAAIILGVIAILFFPIILGPAGIVLGAVAKSKGESKAVVGMTVAACGTVVGMILGALAVVAF